MVLWLIDDDTSNNNNKLSKRHRWQLRRWRRRKRWNNLRTHWAARSYKSQLRLLFWINWTDCSECCCFGCCCWLTLTFLFQISTFHCLSLTFVDSDDKTNSISRENSSSLATLPSSHFASFSSSHSLMMMMVVVVVANDDGLVIIAIIAVIIALLRLSFSWYQNSHSIQL